MDREYLYLVAVMDWYSRKVLSWRLSNPMDASFCLDALTKALDQPGPGHVQHRSDVQLTSTHFTRVLTTQS